MFGFKTFRCARVQRGVGLAARPFFIAPWRDMLRVWLIAIRRLRDGRARAEFAGIALTDRMPTLPVR
jgi:hypothetical protein